MELGKDITRWVSYQLPGHDKIFGPLNEPFDQEARPTGSDNTFMDVFGQVFYAPSNSVRLLSKHQLHCGEHPNGHLLNAG